MIREPEKPDLQNHFKDTDEPVKKFIAEGLDINSIVTKAMNFAFRKGFLTGTKYEERMAEYRKQERSLDSYD